MSTSKFWKELSAEHERALSRDGLWNFKRGINESYFDWAWSRRLTRQPMSFITFLLRNTTPLEQLRALDLNVYQAVTKLTWQYARRHDCLGVTDLKEPMLGNPRRVHFGGRLISQDLAFSSLECNYAFRHSKPNSVLEIGAGYGRVAFAVLGVWPNTFYTICDIEPALSIAHRYLTTLFPGAALRFVTPEELPDLEGPYSHGISISSLSEFKRDTALEYLRHFDRLCRQVYLKQWVNWSNPVDKCVIPFDSLKLEMWETICGPDICQIAVKFNQAVYRTNS